MANEKKNIKVLVATDDDPTAELEALTLSEQPLDDETEAAATTTGYRKSSASDIAEDDADSTTRPGSPEKSDTAEELKFELEVLRAKWQGVSTELDAREDLVNQLNEQLQAAQQTIEATEAQIAIRDERIQSLETTVASRDDAYMALADDLEKLHQGIAGNDLDEAQQRQQLVQLQAGKLAGSDLENRELRARLEGVENYADQLRYQLRRKIASTGDLNRQVEALEQQLAGTCSQVANLQTELEESIARNAELEARMAELHDTHAEEIRTIRFELGDAQETLSQREQVAEELASDLLRTRSQREDLENALAQAEENSQARISEMESARLDLQKELDSLRSRLESKTQAVNSLLAELAQSPQRPESIPVVKDAIQDIDDRVAERIEERGGIDRDRVTRLLTGHIEGQKLRFPLFKDRLTIGRTHSNDIQLKSKHVSRRHAVVVIEGDVTRLIDWGSKNGVFVNGCRVKEHFLKNGDVVSVGTAEFRYEERPKRDS